MRKEVDKLPPPEQCFKPKYIVTGSRYRHGFMEPNRLETLTFPGEHWYKCCMTNPPKSQFVCQEAEVVPFHDLIQEEHGWCGTHFCVGNRNRCLIVNKDVEEVKTSRHKMCPKACPNKCVKERERRECIHIGPEPEAGDEGTGMEQPTGAFDEPYDYEVYSLGVHPLASLLPLLRPSASGRRPAPPGCTAAPCPSARRERWEQFLG